MSFLLIMLKTEKYDIQCNTLTQRFKTMLQIQMPAGKGIILSMFLIHLFITALARCSEVLCYYVSPDRRRPGALALISDSVCAEDDSANLEPTESANCVCLDSNV